MGNKGKSHSKKPIIAILSTYPEDFVSFSGGVETATAALLEGLTSYQDQFEFHVVCLSDTIGYDNCEEHNGFFFHFLSIPHHFWLRPRFIPRVFKTLKELKKINPSVVHSQGHIALSVASILGNYPRVYTVHGICSAEAEVWGNRSGKWAILADSYLQKYVFKYHQYIVSISPYISNMLPKNKIIFQIPNAVRMSFFETADTPSPMEEPYILFAGAITPLKRPNDVIHAIGLLHAEGMRINLAICGPEWDRSYAELLKKKAATLEPGSVHILGNITQESLRTYMQHALALVLPSEQENTPMSIAESMISGCPVIASRVGGVPRMIDDLTTGFLFDVRDTITLAEIIKKVYQDLDRRSEVISNAYSVAAEKYTPEQVAEDTIIAYRSILSDRNL